MLYASGVVSPVETPDSSPAQALVAVGNHDRTSIPLQLYARDRNALAMTSSATTSAPVQPANSAAELLNDASMTPTEASVSATRADRLLAQFSSFRSELDAHQAQRERIVKLSRDVTALSKQLIFALHRVGSGRDMASVVREAEGKFKDLRGLFEKLQGEVTGADFWRRVPVLLIVRSSLLALTHPSPCTDTSGASVPASRNTQVFPFPFSLFLRV